MASKEQREELKQKITAFVADHFNGDFRQAFHYYSDHNNCIGRPELIELLANAGVATHITRGLWAKAIIAELDADGDGQISMAEFEVVLK